MLLPLDPPGPSVVGSATPRALPLLWRGILTFVFIAGVVFAWYVASSSSAGCTGGNECGLGASIAVVFFTPPLFLLLVGVVWAWIYWFSTNMFHITAASSPPLGWYTPVLGERLVAPVFFAGVSTSPERGVAPAHAVGWFEDPLDSSRQRFLSERKWTGKTRRAPAGSK